MPTDGTATDTGKAGGLYACTSGSDRGEDEGESVIDEHQGALALIADFGDGPVGGIGGVATSSRSAQFGVFLGRDPIDRQGLAQGL